MRKITALLLALLLLLSMAGCGETAPKALSEYTNENPPIAGILSVQRGQLRDENGKKVVLFGINLGNWMLQETWMNAITGYSGQWAQYDTLELWTQRFGEEQTAQLVKAYEDHFITEKDIEQIEKLGFNCVRVPFWYRNFMREDGSWLTENMDDNPGFQRLDWLIGQCGAHGIYVILDLHGAPGGQSTNHSTGKAGRNVLYTNELCMEMAERLWTAIADRYKDSPVVAAYDLLNEPQNNGDTYGVNNWRAESEDAVKNTNAAYDRLYRAVRSVDSEHLISLEGIWSTSVLPDPKEMGYENMLYQLHLYDTDKGMIQYRVNELKTARRKWDVAVLVGEFNNFAEEAYACRQYSKNNISYVKWTYKTMNTGDNWGLFNGNVGYIDSRQASYEEILRFFEEELDTADYTFNETEMNRILP